MKKVKWLFVIIMYTILMLLLLYMLTEACNVTSDEWLDSVRKAGQYI